MDDDWGYPHLYRKPPYLVGGTPTPLKNMKVSWDDYSQYMESHKSHVPVTTNQIWKPPNDDQP